MGKKNEVRDSSYPLADSPKPNMEKAWEKLNQSQLKKDKQKAQEEMKKQYNTPQR